MAYSYNKTVGTGSTIICILAAAGAIFLGLGVTAQGHTWQVIAGGS